MIEFEDCLKQEGLLKHGVCHEPSRKPLAIN